MIIKEGSIINIIDKNDVLIPVVKKIIAQEDIEIEDSESNYTFLLRNRECKENCIFESDKIYKKDNAYIVEGYFKDAILVVTDRCKSKMYNSYMAYEN